MSHGGARPGAGRKLGSYKTKARADEPIARRLIRLRNRKCGKGHDRRDGIVEIDHRSGGVKLRCRECHRERLRRYHAEGRAYRYA